MSTTSTNTTLQEPKPLAAFKLSTKQELSFEWKPNQFVGDLWDGPRRVLADCVLAITPRSGETMYYILRAEPRAPKRDHQSWNPEKKNTGELLTRFTYKFDSDSSFEKTSNKMHITQCKLKLIGKDGREAPHLERQADGSWVCTDNGGGKLLSVSLDKTTVLMDLHDKDPTSLSKRKTLTEMQIKKKSTDLSKVKESKKTGVVEIPEIKDEVDDLNRELKKIEALVDLWNSSLDATIIYAVDGLRFEIARLDSVSFPHVTPQ